MRTSVRKELRRLAEDTVPADVSGSELSRLTKLVNSARRALEGHDLGGALEAVRGINQVVREPGGFDPEMSPWSTLLGMESVLSDLVSKSAQVTQALSTDLTTIGALLSAAAKQQKKGGVEP